jgi:hypothetical protein
LEFKPVPVVVDGAVQMWAAANSEYAFRIVLTHRFLAEADGDGDKTVYVKVPKPVFVAYVSFLDDSSHRCQIDRCF